MRRMSAPSRDSGRTANMSACLKSAEQRTSLLDCLPHHTFDVRRFGVGISLAIRLMFGDKSSFEPLVSPSFLWMSAQIVPERQPLPHLSMRLRHMHMVGAP